MRGRRVQDEVAVSTTSVLAVPGLMMSLLKFFIAKSVSTQVHKDVDAACRGAFWR
jgi:hypothetical protein